MDRSIPPSRLFRECFVNLGEALIKRAARARSFVVFRAPRGALQTHITITIAHGYAKWRMYSLGCTTDNDTTIVITRARAHHGSSPGRRSTKFRKLNFKKGDAGAADKDYSRGNLVCMSRSIYEYIRCARCVRDLFWWKISLSTLKRRALRRPLAFTDRPLDGRAPKWLIGRIDCVLGVLILFKSG